MKKKIFLKGDNITIQTRYPNTVSQSSQDNSHFREFDNLNNVKNNNSTYARSKNTKGGIASKNGTHHTPSAITATNFKFNIPEGSKINSVTVEYAVDKEGSISIAGPTVNILRIAGENKKGKALTTTVTKTSLTWTGNHYVSTINSSDFGVKIAFPQNTSTNTGYVKVKYIRIIVDYTEPNFSLSAQRVSGEYWDIEDFLIKVDCINNNRTNDGTNVVMTLPENVNLVGMDSGNGNVSGPIWTTQIGGNASASAILRFLVTASGTYTITFKETSTNHTTSITFTASKKPVVHVNDDNQEYTSQETEINNTDANNPTTDYITVTRTEIFELKPPIRDDFYDELHVPAGLDIILGVDPDLTITLSKNRTENGDDIYYIPSSLDYVRWHMDNGLDITEKKIYCRINDVGDFQFTIGAGIYHHHPTNVTLDENGNLVTVNVTYNPFWEGNYTVIPLESDLSTPFLTVISQSEEELNRLGDGVNYIVESYLKAESETYHDWYKNFHIGVFNNEIDGVVDYSNLSNDVIFSNTEYWSNNLSSLDTFEKLGCEFTYNEDYPLYILFVGDYPEGDSSSVLHFTSPTIKQTDTATVDDQCIFPVPIKNLISEEISTLSLSSFSTSNGVVLYGFDLDGIETDENNSIIGVQVNITADVTENMSILLKLKNQNKKPGERSVIVTNDDANNRLISVGGLYDLWGFEITDFTNLDEWELEVVLSNYWLSSEDASINIENVEIIFYHQKISDSIVRCFVNGVDTRHVGMFIEDVSIPTGLKSKVKYLDIDGSDRNDAYLMNIDKQEITIKFSVEGCNIEETTNFLKLIGKLFSNARGEHNELNKPIPNKLEFSHRPDEYWNVILENPIDTSTDVVEYSGTLKLIVPDGTSWSKVEKMTHIVGNNTSIAKVNPTIIFTPSLPISNSIEIIEKNSKQTFIANYDDFRENDIVIMDCSSQKLYLRRFDTNDNEYVTSDISEAVDWSTDWFSLFGEYYFESNNCIIQMVKFRERW